MGPTCEPTSLFFRPSPRRRVASGMLVSIVSLSLAMTAGSREGLALHPEFLWAKQLGGPGDEFSHGIAAGGSGDFVITGSFFNSTAIDGTPLSGPEVEALVARFDAAGNLRWLDSPSGPNSQSGSAVTLDPPGNVVVAGAFMGTSSFDGVSLTAAGGPVLSDIFLAKYAGDGRLSWVRQAGGAGGDHPNGVATDRSGNIFVTGYILSDTADFDGTVLTNAGFGDIFVAAYDSGGSLLWVKQAGGTSLDQGQAIATDRAGNVIVTGQFGDSDPGTHRANFDGTVLTSAGHSDLFLAKYDGTGRLLWVKRAGGEGNEKGRGVATDRDGNILVTGYFSSTSARFDGRVLSADGFNDVFLAKYDPDGTLLWVDKLGGVQNDLGTAVVVDSVQNVYVAGDLGTSPSTSSDLFIAKYGPAGAQQWLKRTAGVTPFDLSIEPGDNLLVTGVFSNTVTLDSVNLTSAGLIDMFVARLGEVFDPAGPDGCEDGAGNESAERACVFSDPWEHTHWLCSREIRRALGDLDADCPDIFENRVGDMGADEIWTMEIPNLTLERTDRDFYRVRLPDPAVPEDEWPQDIRPSVGPFRESDPVVLPECDFVQREEIGPDLRERTVNVTIRGRLTVRIIPEASDVIDRPVSTLGESLRLYDGALTPIGSGSFFEKTIECPRTGPAALREIIFSFGERSGTVDRDVDSQGGYRVELEYRIEARRDIPDWARDEVDEDILRSIGSLPCLGALPPIGPPIGRFAEFPLPSAEVFPFCPGGDLGLARIGFLHPFDSTRPDCGPNEICRELFLLHWPAGVVDFDLLFASSEFLTFQLFDLDRTVIAKGIPAGQFNNEGQFNKGIGGQMEFLQRMFVPDIKSGLYLLAVEGPPSAYTVEFVPPIEKKHEVRVPDVEIGPHCSGEQTIYVRLDTEEAIKGFTLGMTWKPAEFLEILEIKPGPDVPEEDLFFFVASVEDGVRGLGKGEALVGMALNGQNPEAVVGPGQNLRVLQLRVRARPGAKPGSRVTICFEDGLGEPPQNTILSVPRRDTAVSVSPDLRCGTLTVSGDPTPPTIRCPDDIVVPCGSPNGGFVDYKVEATDACGEVTVSCEPPSGSFFPPGTTLVVCTATDESGNTSRCEFTVTVPGDECFRRGDSNTDGLVDITDGINTLAYLFLGTVKLNCPDSADFDDSGVLDITDSISTFTALFIGGKPAPPPGSKQCGVDPTPDRLDPCELGCK